MLTINVQSSDNVLYSIKKLILVTLQLLWRCVKFLLNFVVDVDDLGWIYDAFDQWFQENKRFNMLKQTVALAIVVWTVVGWFETNILHVDDPDFARYEYAHPIMYIRKAYIKRLEDSSHVDLNLFATMRCTRARAIQHFPLFVHGKNYTMVARVQPMREQCPPDLAAPCDWFAWWIVLDNLPLKSLQNAAGKIKFSLPLFDLDEELYSDLPHEFLEDDIVPNKPPSHPPQQYLVVCLANINYQTDWFRFVHFFETWRVVGGVIKFYVYWHSSSPQFREMLRVYEESKLIEVTEWSWLPRTRGLETPANESSYMANEHTAHNDCLLRHRHQVEIMVMLRGQELPFAFDGATQTVNEMIQAREKQFGKFDIFFMMGTIAKEPKRLEEHTDIALSKLDLNVISNLHVGNSMWALRTPFLRTQSINHVDHLNDWYPGVTPSFRYTEPRDNWLMLHTGDSPEVMIHGVFMQKVTYPNVLHLPSTVIDRMNHNWQTRLKDTAHSDTELQIQYYTEELVDARRFEFKHRMTFCPSQWFKGPTLNFSDWVVTRGSWKNVLVPSVGKYSPF